LPTRPPPPGTVAVIERVRGTLATKNLTIARVSRQSLLQFPEDSRCRLPEDFYYHLRSGEFSPDIFQLFVLSATSGYRLEDWLRVFGFHLEEIPRLQLALAPLRTTLLDSMLADTKTLIPWFSETAGTEPPITPASQLFRATGLRRIESLPGQPTGKFLYAILGQQDAFAFPDLLPGSLVRVDTEMPDRFLPDTPGEPSRNLFLVNHAKGFVCCRLRPIDRTHFTLTSSEAYAHVTLELSREFHLVGVVDLEIRRLDPPEQPEVPPDLARFWSPPAFPSINQNLRVSELLRTSRLRAGLSFREASSRSRKIAEEMGDARFSIGAGTLSDYEASDDPPRHIHKILSLLVLYAIPFGRFLEGFGLRLRETRQDAIPDTWLGHEEPAVPGETFAALGTGGVLEKLVQQLQELPYFLGHSLDALTGIADLSLRDVFWMGGNRISLHPYLRHALFVAVNRRLKRPPPPQSGPLWRQHLYLLLTRKHGYLLGRCHREGDLLVVHPFSNGLMQSERFRNHSDAEVIGRVVAIVRRILPEI